MLTPPSDPAVESDATRRAFLKKVAIGGAAAAIGTQVLPLRAFAQEEGETTEPGTEGEEEVELTPDEERMTFLAGIALAGATVYRAATGDETPAEEDEEEDSGGSTTTTTTLPPITVPSLAEPVVEVLRVFGSHHSQQA
ncbi:MAG TPA: twin-arginine translocation signal domain-containing protein, partial [Iamia sp.]|nr:twin-arginine translocation signal domain-containing protein [Iamia sp.]